MPRGARKQRAVVTAYIVKLGPYAQTSAGQGSADVLEAANACIADTACKALTLDPYNTPHIH